MSETEFIAAIEAALRPTSTDAPGYMTVRELCKATGKANTRIREHLATLMDDGRLDRTTVSRPGIDGRMCQVAAYRIKD